MSTRPPRSRARALAPRKQPLQDRSAQTFADLVEAAALVLETAGFEGFNTNAVAERAGVSVGSLYQYFPSKDGLIVALMRREDERFFDEAVAALQSDGGRETMARYIEVAVRQQLARPRLARLLDIEEGRPDLQRALKGSKDFRPMLEDVIARADMPTQASPARAVMDVSAIIRGLTDGAGERGETDQADLGRRVNAAVFGYLEGMRARPAKRASNASKNSLRSSGRP